MPSQNKTLVYYSDASILSDPALFQVLYEKQPIYRQKKIDDLRFDTDKRLSLGAGVLLQRALWDAGLDGREVQVQFGEHGKPYFADLPQFHFSLSHSGSMVLCAVSEYEIGCDVERIRDYKERLAKRFFHPQEIDALEAQTDAEAKRLLFYRIWTLKESFLKATGRGLSLPLNSFAVLTSDDDLQLQLTAEPNDYQLYSFDVAENYSCACCVCEEDGKKPQLIEASLTE